MKLYATVTSERASKGQGGNEYLNIVLKDEDAQEFARLVITIEENGIVIAYDHDEDSTIVERWKGLELAETKGEKQKGECGLMKGYDVCDNVNCTHPLTA